jgi:hypothetical protein
MADEAACELIVMPRGARDYGAALYSALRRADALGPALIAIERPPASGTDAEETALWASIADRLARATRAPA